MRKYEFTDNQKTVEGRSVRQIRALRDIPEHRVQTGDLGGWQTTENLPHEGNSWIGIDAVLLNSKVHGNTYIQRGVIEDSEVHARLIVCKSIRKSNVDGAGIAIRHSAVLLDSEIKTTVDMEISAGVYMEKVKIVANGYVQIGEDTHIIQSSFEGSDIYIGAEITIKKTQVEGNDIRVEQSSKLNKVRIYANKVELKLCDFEDLRIDGDDIRFLRAKFHKGRLKGKSILVNYGWDIHNTHFEGERIRMEATGESVLHNASIKCNDLRILGDVKVDWVYFEGKNIELDGVIKLTGIYQSLMTHFEVKDNVKISGNIEMKMNEKPITLMNETIEGDFNFIS